MDDATRDLLSSILAEFGHALDPLLRAAQQRNGLYTLLGQLGWDLQGLIGETGAEVSSALLQLHDALLTLASVADAADTATAVQDVIDSATSAWQTVDTRRDELATALLDGSLPAADPDLQLELGQALAGDLLGLLIERYLANRQPAALTLATAFGLLVRDDASERLTATGERLRYPVRRMLPASGALQPPLETLFRDPAAALLGTLKDLLASDSPATLEDLAAITARQLTTLLVALRGQALGLTLRVDADRLELSGLDLALTDTVNIPLPQPVDDLSLELSADRASLVWLRDADAGASGGAALPLFEAAGFSVSLTPHTISTGDQAGDQPGNPTAPERGLTLAMVDDVPTFTLAGGLEVGLPLDRVALGDGGRVSATAQGQLVFGMDGSATVALHRAEASVVGVRLGGAGSGGGGPTLDGLLAIEGLTFPFDPDPAGFSLQVDGKLTLAANTVSVSAELDGDGFRIHSTGQVDLGSGILLAPPDDPPGGTTAAPPVLSLHGSSASATVSGTLAGRLVLDEIAAELWLSGNLTAGIGSGSDAGMLEIQTLSAATGVLAELPLPGGVVLDQAAVSLNYGADALALAVAGHARIPAADGSNAGLAMAGALELDGLAAPPRIASLQASTELVDTLDLPGNLALEQARAELGFAAGAARMTVFGRIVLGQGMTLSDTNGAVELAAEIGYDATDPLRITLAGQLDAVDLSLGDDVHLFGATVTLQADSGPGGANPTGGLQLSNAAGGLVRRPGTSGSLSTDYQLALLGVTAGFAFTGDGFTLSWTDGTLQLPPGVFASDGGGTPSVELSGAPGPADVTNALTLSYSAGTLDLALSGRLVLRNFGLALPGDSGLSARLEQAVLVLDGSTPPLLQDLAGEVRLPLPGGNALVIGLQDVAWGLDGLPTGALLLDSDLDAIDIGGGFLLRILGSDPDDPTAPSSLSVTANGDHRDFVLDGGLSITAPVELLSDADATGGTGATVSLAGRGVLRFSSDLAQAPTISDLALALRAQRLRFGGPGGLLVEDAEVLLTGIDALLDPNATEALTLAFTGTMQAGAGTETVMLGLDGAVFRFVDGPFALALPEFEFAGISVGSDAPVLGGLITLREVGIGFADPGRPLLPVGSAPPLLAPDNIQLTLSADLAIDTASGVLVGGVQDTLMYLDGDGRPVIRLDGFNAGIDGLDIGITSLTGALAVQGLTGANPPRLVGKLGGQYQGMGLEFLCAVGVEPLAGTLPILKPLGACLDVSAGSTGISLAYGFTLNGASGGVSFQNSNASPCDFKAYLGLDDDGNPVPPSLPAAGGEPATSAPGVATARPLPYGPCPAPCPPESMNPLCQPHPDPQRYPNRAILRFSSLDSELLESIGLREWVDQYFPDLNTLDSDALAALLRDRLATLLPAPSIPVSVPDPALQAILNDPLGHLTSQFVQLLAAAADAALTAADPPTPWELVSELAYAGIPCPDVTLQVTGTFSYVGVSAFASVTGGVTVSSTGTVGVLGWLNIFNIPVGQLRAFLTLTGPDGDPDPSLCGDLRLGVGPLDIGQVGFTEWFQGADFVDGTHNLLPQLFNQAAADVGLALDIIADAIVQLDPELPALNDLSDPVELGDAVAGLSLEQAAALVMRIAERMTEGGASHDPGADRVQDFLLELLELMLYAYDPRAVFCGSVSPKLFGLPLAGGDVVAFQGWGSSTDIGGQFAFSPSYLLGRVIPGADLLGAMDRASIGFAMAFPDPREMLLDGLAGHIGDLGAYMDAGIEELLEQAVFTFSYDIAPFGLTLARSAGRVLLPRLTDHPDDPANFGTGPDSWTNPDLDPQLPDRLALLAATLQGPPAGGHLADLLWEGRLNELEVPGYGWPTQDLYLGRDYFPHGGLVGAGHLQLPRALVDAPPLELFATILDPDAAPLERLAAAAEYVSDYLGQSVEQGSLGFYIPAPNPPLFRVDGETLGPRALLESITTLDLQGLPLLELPGYRADLAFLLGELNGQLLGLPLVHARVELTPPAGPGSTARLLVTASIPPGSALAALIDSAELRFEFSQPPTQPIAARVQALVAALSPDPAMMQAALDALTASLAETDERLSGIPLPDLDQDADGPVTAAAVMRQALEQRRAPAQQQLRAGAEALAPSWRQTRQLAINGAVGAVVATTDLLQQLTREFASALPKLSLSAGVSGLNLPEPLSGWLAVDGNLRLRAWSPWFDPDAEGDGAVARAQRGGGIVLNADLRLTAGNGPGSAALLDLNLPATEFALIPTAPTAGAPPILRARRQINNLPIPGSDQTLDQAWVEIDSAPADDGEGSWLRIGGQTDGFEIDKLALAADGDSPLSAELRLRPVPGQPLGALDLQLAPARVRLPLLAASARLQVHGGDGPDSWATLATHGPWSIAVTVESLALQSPYDPDDPPLLDLTAGGAAAPQVTLEGDGLNSATLVLELPPVSARLLPHVPALSRALPGGFTLRAESDGDIDGQLDLPPLDFGVLRLHGAPDPDTPIRVRMRPYGFGLPLGFRVSLMGLSDKRIRLRACVLDGFGHFSASATSRTVALGDWLKFSSSSLKVWNEPHGAGFSVRKARVRLLPNADYFKKARYLSLELESLDIDTDGRFAAVVEDASISVPKLFSMRGRLELGNDPGPGEPLQPYLHLNDAELTVPLLPKLQGDLDFRPDRVRASVSTSKKIKLKELLKLEPGDWELHITPGGPLQLSASQISATLLGATVTLTDLVLKAADDAWSLTARADNLGSHSTGMLAAISGDIDLSFAIDADGSISAQLSAEFDLSDHNFPDFGRQTLSYDSDDPDYPFRVLIQGAGAVPDHALLFGPSGSKICVATPGDGDSPTLGPCFPPL